MRRTTILILLSLLVVGCQYQQGNSTDYVYGYDKGILWNHLYLKDDHSTCYCFDDVVFLNVLQRAKDENLKVEVTYGKYVVTGSLCSCDEKYEKVIVTNIKIKEEVK